MILSAALVVTITVCATHLFRDAADRAVTPPLPGGPLSVPKPPLDAAKAPPKGPGWKEVVKGVRTAIARPREGVSTDSTGSPSQ
jgi:hypothetical protein